MDPHANQKGPFDGPTNQSDVFGTYVSLTIPMNGSTVLFDIDLQFKETTHCVFDLVGRNCSFSPAIVSYPVVIDGNSRSIALAPGTNTSDDKVLRMLDPDPNQGITGTPAQTSLSLNTSTYGGLFKVLYDGYQSSASMVNTAITWELRVNGPLVSRYVNMTGQPSAQLNCTLNFVDPTEDILTDIRGLMFRTAMASADLSQRPADLHRVVAQLVELISLRGTINADSEQGII